MSLEQLIFEIITLQSFTIISPVEFATFIIFYAIIITVITIIANTAIILIINIVVIKTIAIFTVIIITRYNIIATTTISKERENEWNNYHDHT